MNCSPTLTAEEFKVLHNTLWELGNIEDPVVKSLVERIRTVALKGAYEQDSRAFDTKNDHYTQVAEEEGFTSIWSMYEIEDLDAEHPYPSDTFVVYKDHWGTNPVHCAVYGRRWRDIYRAADNCIRLSEDGHHIFIEQLRRVNGNELILTTGS